MPSHWQSMTISVLPLYSSDGKAVAMMFLSVMGNENCATSRPGTSMSTPKSWVLAQFILRVFES